MDWCILGWVPVVGVLVAGCGSSNSFWYWTDTGVVTVAAQSGTDPMTLITLGCVKGLCTTDPLPVDAARD